MFRGLARNLLLINEAEGNQGAIASYLGLYEAATRGRGGPKKKYPGARVERVVRRMSIRACADPGGPVAYPRRAMVLPASR